MASQDAWAKPLAKQLVDLYRCSTLDYVRVGTPVYDPATGDSAATETTFTGVGAVLPTVSDAADDTAGNALQITVAIDLAGVGNIVPTTRDRLLYLGKTYKVIDVQVSSGDQLYSATLTGRAN